MRYDLIVVGAGVMGAFHAYHALKSGLKVLLLEKDSAPRQASVRNFGQVVPSGLASGVWQQRGIESTRLYKQLQQQTDLSIRQSSSLYVASDDDELGLCEELHSVNEHQRYSSIMLSAGGILERYPLLKPEYVRGGLYFPQEICLEPRWMVQRLIAYMVEQMSLEYWPNTLVVGAEGGNARVLLWDTGDHFFGATRAVICNGRDFKALYPEVFERSEIQLVKLQMMQTVPVQVQLPVSVLTGLTIRRYESFAECSSWPLDRSHLDPRLQEWGIHILFKQAVDGSLVIGDSHEYASVVQADSLGFELRADINNLILAEAKKILDLPSWEIATTWAGYYSQHPDGVFQKEVEPGIHVITAIGGKGMTCSPALAGEHIGSMFNLD